MEMEGRFRLKYIVDYETGVLKLDGARSVFNSDGEVRYKEHMLVTTTIQNFLYFCRVCIAYEQGDNKKVDIAEYGIQFRRETFEDRYFYCGKLQVSIGETYILYELFSKKLNPKELKFFRFYNLYAFVHKNGYLILSDKTCLNVGFFRYHLILGVKFTLNENDKSGDAVGYGVKVPIGKIQYAFLEKGACHPYVNLQYRDMCINISLNEFYSLQSFLTDYDWEEDLMG